MNQFWIGLGIGAFAGAVVGFSGCMILLRALSRDIEDDRKKWRKQCEKKANKRAKQRYKRAIRENKR